MRIAATQNAVTAPAGQAAAPPATAPTATSGPTDTVDYADQLQRMSENAENFHAAGDYLGMGAFFGMVLYIPAAMAAGAALGIEGAAPILGVLCGGGLLGG